MSLTLKQRLELSQIRANRARDTLLEAEFNLKAGMFRTSVNRSYYAVLYAAKALLILKGVDPVKHEGVKTMLALEFEKKGLLPKGTVLKFKEIMDKRLVSDYDDLIEIGQDHAERVYSLARDLVETLIATSKKLISNTETK